MLVLILSLIEPYRQNALGNPTEDLLLCSRCGVGGGRALALDEGDPALLPVLPAVTLSSGCLIC